MRAKRIARNSAVYIELSSGSRQVNDLLIRLVDSAAAVTPYSVLEPSMKIFSDKGYSEISCTAHVTQQKAYEAVEVVFPLIRKNTNVLVYSAWASNLQ